MSAKPDPRHIRCLGCNERFRELETYLDHLATADHVDKGDAWNL